MKPKTIKIDDVEYVRADNALAPTLGGMPYVIIRGDRSGVFAGYLESEGEKHGAHREVTMRECRRLWYWLGATLAQVAEEGAIKVSNGEKNKWSVPMTRVRILDAIEIIDCTATAAVSIQEEPEWKRS